MSSDTVEQHAKGLNRWTPTTDLAVSCKINRMLDGVDADESKTVYLDKCRYYQYRMVQMDMKMHHLDYQAAKPKTQEVIGQPQK